MILFWERTQWRFRLTVGSARPSAAWDYFYDPQGDLYRARSHHHVETRTVEFVAPQAKAAFALRLARLAAGLPELGN